MEPAQTISLISSMMTPAAIMVAVMLGFPLLARYLREGGRSSTVVTVGPETGTAQNGGFAFVDVADEHKVLFADAMNGFADFAKVKGYSVELSFDTSLPGKVGIRFTILDSGVTVSTATVRKDVDEYIDRLRSEDDLSDLPMATNSVEHVRLTSALQARFSYLRTQAEMYAVQIEFYKRFMDEWKAGPNRGIGYTSPVQIHLTNANEGPKSMRDSYNAENSQNIAQGRQAKAITKDSTVLIGSTLTEKSKQVSSLKELEAEIIKAELPAGTKETAVRHVQNAIEEMQERADPSPDDVGKWLGRADSALKTAGAAAGLLDKLHEALGMFGLTSGGGSAT